MSVKLVSYTPEPERMIELAYLSCRNLDPWTPDRSKTLEERIDAMWMSGHLGPFEFADATFYISGVSRNLSHQFVRHRLMSFCQLSMRAVNVKDLPMINPPSFGENNYNSTITLSALESIYGVYDKLIKSGIPLEDARYVLPNGIETRFMVKANFREWLHFLRLRTEKHAQWEIRLIAEQIWTILQDIAPEVFSEKYIEYWG